MNLTSTDEKHACFLASTPLQLICCSEAREHYKITHPLLVMVKPDNKPTVDQMKRLADRLGWKDEQIIWMKKNAFYFHLPFVIKKLKKIPFDYVFTGNLGSWAQEIIFTNLDADMICVDDGMATIAHSKRFREKGFISSIKIKKSRILSVFGLSATKKHINNLKYFSFFELKSDEKVQFEHNNFSLLAKTFHSETKKFNRNAIAFIGQPFGNTAEYEKLRFRIIEIIKSNPEKEFVYFPHRKERPEIIRRYLVDIGVQIFIASWPIEIEITNSGFDFVSFYSYTSTALFTIKTMHPNMDVFQIDDPSVFTHLGCYNDIKETLAMKGVISVDV